MAGNNSIYQSQSTPQGAMTAPAAHGQRFSSMFADAAPAINQALEGATNLGLHQLDDDSRAWAVKATSEADLGATQMFENAKSTAKDGADGFTDAVSKDWKKYQDDLLAKAPNNEAKRLLNEHLTTVSENLTAKSDTFMRTERQAWRSDQITKAIDADTQVIGTLGDGEIQGAVEGALGKLTTYYKDEQMPPDAKRDAIEKARTRITNAAMMRQIQVNPQSVINLGKMTNAPTSQDGIISHVMHEMEGGDTLVPDGKGIAKFGINSKANPDVDVKNLTEEKATELYKERYWDKANIGALPANMQLLAFDTVVNHGVGAGKELIKQANGDPAKLLELRAAEYQRIATENPEEHAKDLKGWNNRLNKLASGIAANPDAPSSTSKVWNLGTFEQQVKWSELAERYATRQERETDKATAQQRAIFNSDFEIGITRGEKTYADIDLAYAKQEITPEQHTKYTLQLDTRDKKEAKGAEATRRVGLAVEGKGTLDPKNTDDRKAVDENYSAWHDNALQSQGRVDRTAQVEQIGKYGIVPEMVRADIRGGLRSVDTDNKVSAADLLDRLRQKNPALVDDFAEEDIKDAVHLQSYVQAGYNSVEAAKMVTEAQKITPEIKKMREDTFKDLVKKTPVEATIKNAFTSWNPFGAEWNNSSAIPPAMQSDFTQLAQAEYLRTGNWEAAQKTATTLLEKTWGATQVASFAADGTDNNRGFWMKNPPEKYYAAPEKTFTAEKQSEWMREQLVDEINAGDKLSGKTIKPEDITLTVSPRTTPDGKPTYNVWYRHDGVTDIYSGGDFTWHPQWEGSKERERLLRRESDKKKRDDSKVPGLALVGDMAAALVDGDGDIKNIKRRLE